MSYLIQDMSEAITSVSSSLCRDFREMYYLQNSGAGAKKFLTSAHLRCTESIVEKLKKCRSDYGLIVNGTKSSMQEYMWYVVAIDSKANFLNAIGSFAVCVAIFHKGEVTCSVVSIPIMQETFFAERSKGVFYLDYNLRKMKMKPCIKDQASPVADLNYLVKQKNLISQLHSLHTHVRSIGSVFSGFVYFALSRFETISYLNLDHFTKKIGEFFVHEGGGRVINSSGRFIATNNSKLDQTMRKSQEGLYARE